MCVHVCEREGEEREGEGEAGERERKGGKPKAKSEGMSKGGER